MFTRSCILWVNADAVDHQQECAKDGMVYPKKNLKRSWQNIKQKIRVNKFGKELEYNSALDSSDFWVLLYDLFRSNYVQQRYRFLGWHTLGHYGHGNCCTGYCVLDRNYQMATSPDQEVESKAKQKELKQWIIQLRWFTRAYPNALCIFTLIQSELSARLRTQSKSDSRLGWSKTASWVSLYSTVAGTVAKTVRVTKPLASNSLNRLVTVVEEESTLFFISEKRIGFGSQLRV